MSRDWHDWYRAYDDPTTSLSRRLVEVRRQVVPLLDRLRTAGPARVVSLCAGDGRDLLPDLPVGVPTLLVELDPDLADRARATARDRGLGEVEVRTADAGRTDSYAGHVPADLLLACGVFGNIADADLLTTVAGLPGLLAPGAHVVWTRGAEVPDDPTEATGDPADAVRAVFAGSGFEEVALVRPVGASFRVGVHRLVTSPAPFRPGERLFTFV